MPGSAAITLDGAGGIYIAGDFSGTPDFNPSSATFSLTSAGDTTPSSGSSTLAAVSSGPARWAARVRTLC